MLFFSFLFSLWVSQPTPVYSFGTTLIKTQDEMTKVYQLADAIEICEGYYVPGSQPQRKNNPGSISGSNGLLTYETPLEGRIALESLLYRKYRGQTPEQINKRYAADPNWHKCVTSML